MGVVCPGEVFHYAHFVFELLEGGETHVALANDLQGEDLTHQNPFADAKQAVPS